MNRTVSESSTQGRLKGLHYADTTRALGKNCMNERKIAVPGVFLPLKLRFRQLFSPVTRLAFKLEVFTTLTPCHLIIHRAQHKPGEAWGSR